MRKGFILIVIIFLSGSLALFADPSTITFNVTSNVALINQIAIKGVDENAIYGQSLTFNLDELTTVTNLHIADLKYTTNARTGVNLGIVGEELESNEGHYIPYTLTLGDVETTTATIKLGYPSGNKPSDKILTPSPLTQLHTTIAEVYLTIPGNVRNYPAGSYTGTITFTLGAK